MFSFLCDSEKRFSLPLEAAEQREMGKGTVLTGNNSISVFGQCKRSLRNTNESSWKFVSSRAAKVALSEPRPDTGALKFWLWPHQQKRRKNHVGFWRREEKKKKSIEQSCQLAFFNASFRQIGRFYFHTGVVLELAVGA